MTKWGAGARRATAGVLVAGLSLAGALSAGVSLAPETLAETGLYADPATLAVDPSHLAYAPVYPLWSDGAVKRRFLALPAGATIDATAAEAWVFPIGTRFWKEFSFAGRKVETRYMEKGAGGAWTFAAYAWNEAQTAAVRVPDRGLRNHAAIDGGARHDIPGVVDCKVCHEAAGRDAVLGFTALQLTPERDPVAPHAEALLPGMIDLGFLLRERRLAHAPDAWSRQPPRIPARSSRGRAALGYLHANCGPCHHEMDDASSAGLWLRASFAGPETALPAWRTAVGQPSRFPLPGAGPSLRIAAGDPEHSTLIFRMATRNPLRQMPPLGTKLVDDEAVALLRAWIAEDLGAADVNPNPGGETQK